MTPPLQKSTDSCILQAIRHNLVGSVNQEVSTHINVLRRDKTNRHPG